MKVLLSIKPEFAEKIFSGEKQYEFRKVLFKRKGIKTVVLYVSHPVQKVVGEFDVEAVYSEEVESLWKRTGGEAGISLDYYRNYFNGRTIGHAIKITAARKYPQPLCIRKDFNAVPPQSFFYL